MTQPTVIFTPTLVEVKSRFASWRKNKKHRSRIPEELWAAAVMLSREHSIHKIVRALSLSYTGLKKRVESHQLSHSSCIQPPQGFIPIDISPTHSTECTIEMEHLNGNRMRMHFKGESDLDLQSFAELFWRGKV